jgi:hypothetical protein
MEFNVVAEKGVGPETRPLNFKTFKIIRYSMVLQKN